MHRTIETIAFALGVVILGAYGLAEALALLGWRLGPHEGHHGFPWGQVVVATILVAPKLLGRATAGKIWGAIGQRFGAGPRSGS